MAKKSIILSPARNRALFENPVTLKRHLAEQLKLGRLSLVLGAGASFGFGLPNWSVLIDRCLAEAGMSKVAGRGLEAIAEDIRREACGGEDARFAELVGKAMYSTADLSIRALRSNELLAAVAALAMISRRGSVNGIVSFNFDDMLERYLSQSGFSMRSVSDLPCWASNHDVTVYHPHGLLPSDGSAIPGPIVFASIDYDRLRVNKQLWKNLLVEIFCSSTCLFIGLSGNDQNLSAALFEANQVHVGAQQYAFWGVRFSDNVKDPDRGKWEDRGVYQQTLGDYCELPTFLFDICQKAAKL